MKPVFSILVLLFGLFIISWLWITQPVLKITPSFPNLQVNAEKLKEHVMRLSQDFIPRDYEHPENLNRVADYVRQHFQQAGGRVTDQPYEDGLFRNVIASFGPEEGERIVIGAHYDAFSEFPGADDNASGVAGLLELARILGETPPDVPVDLVAYTLEEPPFFRTEMMGSAVHAASLKEQGIQIRLMISLEMIGFFSSEPGSQHFPLPFLKWFYPGQGDFIVVAGRLRDGFLVRNVKARMMEGTQLPIHSINAPPILAGIDFSDHLNYWRQGYPALMITDTAFLRNFNYHTAEDTADKLDCQKMSEVVGGVAYFILNRPL